MVDNVPRREDVKDFELLPLATSESFPLRYPYYTINFLITNIDHDEISGNQD